MDKSSVQKMKKEKVMEPNWQVDTEVVENKVDKAMTGGTLL